MSNYLETIEDEFSRGRGRASMLSPMDWHLAQEWEDKGVPLRIVLGAMTEGFKNFKVNKRRDSINSLRYFTQNVEKEFAEYQKNQVGKQLGNDEISTTEENNMESVKLAESFIEGDENLELIEAIISKLSLPGLPEPLASAVAKLKGELVCLSDQTLTEQLSTDDIEDRLRSLSNEFEISLIASVSDDERGAIINAAKKEFPQYTIKSDVLQKILIRKLYQKFDLPEITLFAF